MSHHSKKFNFFGVVLLLSVLVSGCGQYRLPVAPIKVIPDVSDKAKLSSALNLREVTVKRGDSLYKIAKRFKVSLRELIELNKIRAPYIIYPGSKLKLPENAIYAVKKNQNIYEIAQELNVNPDRLVRQNELFPPYRLKKGQVLRIPSRSFDFESNDRRLSSRKTRGRVASKVTKNKKSWRKLPVKRLPSPTARTDERFFWPVRGQVVIGFGARKGGMRNDGINIRAPDGSPIRAAENGVVAYSGNQLRGFGNLLLIKHDGGWMSAYAHASLLLVQRGDTVRRGQVIARVGKTGNVANPQLHFELRRNNEPVDPRKYLARLAENYKLNIKNFALLPGKVLNKLPGDAPRASTSSN